MNLVPANVLDTILGLTNEMHATMCVIVKRATSLIPMQGYSLIMTNYHYLFAIVTQSRKVYAVTEKAY